MNIPDTIQPVYDSIIIDTQHKLTQLLGQQVTVYVEKKSGPKSHPLRDLICKEFDVTWEGIVNQDRRRPVAMARNAYCYLCSKHLKITMNEVGRHLNRDHTTILAAINRVKELLFVKDPLLTPHIEKLEERIKKWV